MLGVGSVLAVCCWGWNGSEVKMVVCGWADGRLERRLGTMLGRIRKGLFVAQFVLHHLSFVD